MWRVEYENDTGANDDCYHEWWIITNGETSFTSMNEDDAVWLADVLNSRKE